MSSAVPPVSSILDKLEGSQEESFEKILIRMLEPEKAETKTQIENTVAMSQLKMLATWARQEKCFKTAKTIETFIKTYLIYQISKDRQSRKEIISALTEGLKRDKSLAEKLRENPA